MTSDYKNMDDKQLLEALNAGYQKAYFFYLSYTFDVKKLVMHRDSQKKKHTQFFYSAAFIRKMQPVSNNGSTFSRRKSRTEGGKRSFESAIGA